MIRKILTITIFFTFMCSFPIACSKTIYVDDNGNADYKNIQSAIDAANTGDTIIIYSGTYKSNSNFIQIYKQIILQGAETGNDGLPNIEASILINSAQIVNGNIVTNPGATDRSELKNLHISSTHPTYPAVQLYDTNYVKISNCIIESSNTQGITITDSYNNMIQDNTIQNSKTGIYFVSNSNDNTVYNNIFENNKGWGGICLQSRSNNNKIFNNVIKNNKGLAGIYIYGDSNSNTIYDNELINNTWYNAYDQCTNTWYNPTTLSGNYWDDYDGVDANSDSIGDTPYKIADKNNQDPYPLGHFNEIQDDEIKDKDDNQNNPINGDENKNTPGFELIFIILSLAIILFLKKKNKI